MIGIYKITNPKGKVYVGQSIDLTKRIKSYRNAKCKHQILLWRSLSEYGFWSHKIEIIEECSKERLNEREIFHIKKYKGNSMNIKHSPENNNIFLTLSERLLTKSDVLDKPVCQKKDIPKLI